MATAQELCRVLQSSTDVANLGPTVAAPVAALALTLGQLPSYLSQDPPLESVVLFAAYKVGCMGL